MGKLRKDIGDNSQALAQWVGRKLVNHVPITHGTKPIAKGVVTSKAVQVAIDADNPSRVLFTDQHGTTFSIIVTEIGTEERARYRRGKVGANAPGPHDEYLKAVLDGVKAYS